MTKREKINRNIGLTFDFLRQIIRNPKLLNKIPNGSILEFVEKDFPVIEKKASKKREPGKKYLSVKSHLEII